MLGLHGLIIDQYDNATIKNYYFYFIVLFQCKKRKFNKKKKKNVLLH